MQRKIVSIMIISLILYMTIFSSIAYSEVTKLPDGRIVMTQEDFLKLENYISKLENENKVLKEKVELLTEKVTLLEKKNTKLEQSFNELKELSSKQETLYEEQLKDLTTKINKQIEILNLKDIEISIKDERLKAQKQKTLLYSVLALITGAMIDRIVVEWF